MNYKNKEKEPANKIIVDMDDIIKRSQESPEMRKILTEMFPHVFQLDMKFCAVGDILIKKGKNNFYCVTWINSNEIGIINLQYGKSWENRLAVNKFRSKDKNDNIFITRREFEMMSKHYFNDFTVVNRDIIFSLHANK